MKLYKYILLKSAMSPSPSTQSPTMLSVFYPTPRIRDSSSSSSVTEKDTCDGVGPCYDVSPRYGVSSCYGVSPCYGVSLCYGLSPRYGVRVLARCMVLVRTGGTEYVHSFVTFLFGQLP